MAKVFFFLKRHKFKDGYCDQSNRLKHKHKFKKLYLYDSIQYRIAVDSLHTLYYNKYTILSFEL